MDEQLDEKKPGHTAPALTLRLMDLCVLVTVPIFTCIFPILKSNRERNSAQGLDAELIDE
jgi:hypothetical protein